MDELSVRLKRWLASLFPDPTSFSKIILLSDAASDIVDFASQKYPHEFVSLLQGKKRKDTLVISNLIYQHFISSFNSATMNFNLPMVHDVVGSVHSHPGSSGRPSNADIRFFQKSGWVHFIAAHPYSKEHIYCFDNIGTRLEFEILDKFP